MKSKTNISIISNTGVRRKAEIIIGDSGTHASGDILDANAVEQLVSSNSNVGSNSSSGGGISDDLIISARFGEQENQIIIDITKEQLDSKLLKYNNDVYVSVNEQGSYLLLRFVGKTIDEHTLMYIFGASGWTFGGELGISYYNGGVDCYFWSLNTMIEDIIKLLVSYLIAQSLQNNNLSSDSGTGDTNNPDEGDGME